MSVVKFTAVVLCDDIRREISNKDILIGVYSGDIVVPTFPAFINAAFWLEGVPETLGAHDLQLRVYLKDKPPVEMKVSINVSVLGPFGLTVPTLQILVEDETEIRFEFLDGDTWSTLKRKKVIKGDVNQPFTVATASPSSA
jgi:hypothetical protein